MDAVPPICVGRVDACVGGNWEKKSVHVQVCVCVGVGVGGGLREGGVC